MSDEKVWERQALEHLLLENMKEQRRGRRWRTALRLMTLVVFVGIAINVFDFNLGGQAKLGKHTALVNLQGEIAPNTAASAEAINLALNEAFENPESVGVILRINSPGGSPVQSGIIYDEMIRLRALHPKNHYMWLLKSFVHPVAIMLLPLLIKSMLIKRVWSDRLA